MAYETLKRGAMPLTPWPVAFWDRHSGWCDMLPSDMRAHTVRTVVDALLSDRINLETKKRPHILFICGGNADLPPDTETIDDMINAGWEIDDGYTNVSEREDVRRLQVPYVRGEPGTKMEIRITLKTAADWFGPDLPARLCRRAWERLKGDLASRWGDRGATMISTPGRTGLDLLERSLPFGKEYPGVDDELAGLIYANCGQGRIELFGPPRTLPAMANFDGRWMYSSCLSKLPCGPMQHDTLPFIPEHAPGFVLASARVPDDWQHIGLLPWRQYGGDDFLAAHYPALPGKWIRGLWTSAEAHLAWQKGWKMEIDERWLWPNPDSDPAATWRDKLVRLRSDYERAAFHGDEVARALQATVRIMMLHAIGRWYARESYDYGYLPVARLAELPETARYEVRGGIVHYRVPRDLRLDRFRQPHWAATVWGKARRKGALAMLQIPYQHLVSFRTDGIWTDGYDPGWVETGTRGEFRRKPGIAGPIAAPQTDREMRVLLAQRQGE